MINVFKDKQIPTELTRDGQKKANQVEQSVQNVQNVSKTAYATIKTLFESLTERKITPALDTTKTLPVSNELLDGTEWFGSQFRIFRSYPRIFQIVMAGYPGDLVTLITEILSKNGEILRKDIIENLQKEYDALIIEEQSSKDILWQFRLKSLKEKSEKLRKENLSEEQLRKEKLLEEESEAEDLKLYKIYVQSGKEKLKKLDELTTAKTSLMGNMHDDIFNYTINFNNITYNAITLAIFGRQRGILDILLFVLNKTYTPEEVKEYLKQNVNNGFFNVGGVINENKQVACNIDVLNTFVFAELNKPKNITNLILTYGNGNQLEKFDQVTDAIGKVVAPMFHAEGTEGLNSKNLMNLFDFLEKNVNPAIDSINKNEFYKKYVAWLNKLFMFIVGFPIFGVMVIDLFVQIVGGVTALGYVVGGGVLAGGLELIKIMIYTYPRLMLSRLKNNMWNRFTTSSTLEGIISNLDEAVAKDNLKQVIAYLDKAKKVVWVARSHQKILHAIYDVAKKRNWLDKPDFLEETKILKNSFHFISFHNATRWMRSRNGGKKRARPHKTRKNRRNTKLNQT